MVLPQNNEVKQPTVEGPRRFVLISHIKTGKTSLCLKLPNSILIDLEGATPLYAGTFVNVIKESKEANTTPLRALKEVTDLLKKDPRDYVILDSITELESLARPYATTLYRQTLQGKGFTGTDVVSELAQGGGYIYLRRAVEELLNLFEGTYKKGFIILGHVKLASINKDGVDITVRDMDVTGKVKDLVCRKADAVGVMYRGKVAGENWITFKKREEDPILGAWAPHISNQEFVISKLEDDVLTPYWDKIFLELKK